MAGERELSSTLHVRSSGTVRASDYGCLATPVALDGCVVSPEFAVFSVDVASIYPEVLDIYFRTPAVWAAVAGGSTGTNVRRRRLYPEALLAHRAPVPDRATQALLKSMSTEVGRLREVRRRQSGAIAVLAKSLAARAFASL